MGLKHFGIFLELQEASSQPAAPDSGGVELGSVLRKRMECTLLFVLALGRGARIDSWSQAYLTTTTMAAFPVFQGPLWETRGGEMGGERGREGHQR